MALKKFLPLFFIVYFLILVKNSHCQESEDLFSKNITELANEIIKIWPENHCAFYLTRETGYPLLSIACRGNYTTNERRLFLDTLYRKGFFLKEETYKLYSGSGTYLYRTEHSLYADKPVFVKLFLRQAKFLFPQMPTEKAQVLLVVYDLYQEADLLEWQTLGVPLVYAITPFRKDSAFLRQKVEEYGQSAWICLRLQAEKNNPAHGKVLSIEETLRKEDMERFSEELKNSMGGNFQGATYILGSAFAKNIFAIRSLLASLRELSVEYFLEPQGSNNFFETARIMSFRALRADIHLFGKESGLEQRWAKVSQVAFKNNYAIVMVSANNIEARKFLKNKLRTKDRDKFVFLRPQEISE